MAAEDRRTWLDFYAGEQRAWRDHRGLTQDQLARLINYSESTVSMVENAQRNPQPEYIKGCDEAMGTGGALRRLYDELMSRDLTPDWSGRWKKIEAEAGALNYFENSLVPGILQTPEYATAILRAGDYAANDIDARVAERLKRQKILSREKPVMIVAVIDEGVLRRLVGSRDAMITQLEHILTVSEQPNVAVHVVPEGTGAYAGLSGPFVIALLDGHETVYQDAALRGTCVEGPADVAAFKRMWESIRSEASNRVDSLGLIQKAIEEWKRQI